MFEAIMRFPNSLETPVKVVRVPAPSCTQTTCKSQSCQFHIQDLFKEKKFIFNCNSTPIESKRLIQRVAQEKIHYKSVYCLAELIT
jgi:hypothetical protein